VLVPTANLRTKDGQPGVTVTYSKDVDHKVPSLTRVEPQINLVWYTGRPDYATESTFSIRWEGKLVPNQSGPTNSTSRASAPGACSWMGRNCPSFSITPWSATRSPYNCRRAGPMIWSWRSRTPRPVPSRASFIGGHRISMPKKSWWKRGPRHARFTFLRVSHGGLLDWQDNARRRNHHGRCAHRQDSTLGQGRFHCAAWTNHSVHRREARDPIELRIYPGADGQFLLYEDEGDNYDYEKGVYATIASSGTTASGSS